MPDLPTETVTFLFTDIEGSTRLWEQYPDAMAIVLARHDALLRHVIESCGGYVFKTMGDAFCAVFGSALDALAAALKAQRLLQAETWEVAETQCIVPLRVRMALHTGAAQERDGDYFGPALNRIARLLAIGHGQQVLLSSATADQVRDNLPESVSLRDMGSHRLKDLQQPEHVYQLLHPVLPPDFPPLRSLQAYANNLPIQLTAFIGREHEIQEVKRVLSKARLLTLTGSGGCGKTRLALQAAADLLEEYPDGIWLVEFAPLADPVLVPQTVASALQVREEPGRPLTQTLADYLRPKRTLLVWDNCEHLLEACAHLAEHLLQVCEKLQILGTSRERLGIAGEMAYRVPSLALPDPQNMPSVEHLVQYESIRLFADRAEASAPAFDITPANAPVIAQLCCRLDGIPLAIEMAAARVRAMPVEQVAARLEDRFRLLTGGSRTALPRHQTLKALIDWSYNLLSEHERVMLRRLSVFAGGCSLEGAEEVCSGDRIARWEVLDLLTGLVDKSLVIYEEKDGEARYRLLETIRQYGCDRLLESEEAERVYRRHRDYFLGLAEEALRHIRGAEGVRYLDCLETEHDNLRGALDWCMNESESAEEGLRLAGALWRFWSVRGYWSEGQMWLAKALSREGAAGRTKARSDALNGAGNLASGQGDYSAAWSFYEESLAIRRELGDREGVASSLHNLGLITWSQGEYGAAHSLLEESLTIFRELKDMRGVAGSVHCLGVIAREQGEYERARLLLEESLAISRQINHKDIIATSLVNLGSVAFRQMEYETAHSLYEEGLAIFRELGDKRRIAGSLDSLGEAIRAQGKPELARSLFEESLAIFQELDDRRGIAIALCDLGALSEDQGNYEQAHSLQAQSLAIFRELGDRKAMIERLEEMARLATALGQLERAARLWGAGESLRKVIGTPLPPFERASYDLQVAGVRAALVQETFESAWEAGSAMSLEEAVAYALEEKN